VSVASSAAAIDAGRVQATLAALLGGWEGQEDSASVRATFLNGSNGALGSVTAGPVTAADRGGRSALLPRSASARVPPGTVSVRVIITSRRSSGIYNDGYSDNVSLALGAASPKPKPAWPALPDALVPIASVSNGCGGGEASEEWRFGDTSTFRNSNNPFGKRYVVDFREACNLHDAGYSGARVRDVLHGGVVVDFFTWTRKAVDKRFLEDMILICERTIPASAATALADCKATGGKTSFGAGTRFNFVRRVGGLFWKDRPNVRGLWTVTGDAAAPPWAITQSLRMVKAAWRGGTGQPGLRGEFRGTLISRDQDTVIRGFVQITRNGETKLGAMSLLFTPGTVLADKIVVLGPGMRATLKR
jgi:hypothetical protein